MGPRPAERLLALDKSDERLNPKVTLAAQVLPWLQPYVTYSESMRAPTMSETMFGGNHPGGGIRSCPTSDQPRSCGPRVQKGWEFGANIKQNGLFTRGDVFRLRRPTSNGRRELLIGYQSSTFPGPVVNSSSPECGTSHVQGIEVEGLV